MTGIKKEGRLPKIFDERPDTSIKIIVLDLRSNQNIDVNNLSSEDQPASRFKKMPLDFWENVLQTSRVYAANQPTECPIQISGATIDIYSNIVPSSIQQAQAQAQAHAQQQAQQQAQQMMMFNTGLFQPPQQQYNNALVLNHYQQQQNAANVMAIMNAAAAYNNNMYNMNQLTPQFQQLKLQQQAQPPLLMSPQLQPQQQPQQQMLSPQLQHQQVPQPQIKRKPVQLQPTQYISPQIEERLLRKKQTVQQQQVPIQQQQQQPPPPSVKFKKTVRFIDEPIVYEFERYEEEYNSSSPEHISEYYNDGDFHIRDGGEVDEEIYYEDNDPRQGGGYYVPEDEIEQRRHHQYNNYTQQQQHRYPQQQQPEIVRNNNRQAYNNNNDRTRYYYEQQPEEPEEEEESHGNLWERRNFLTRFNSTRGARSGGSSRGRGRGRGGGIRATSSRVQ